MSYADWSLKRYKQGIKGSNKRKQTHEYWLQILKFTLEQAMKAQRGSRGTALLLLQPLREMEMEVKATPQPFYPRPRDLVLTVRHVLELWRFADRASQYIYLSI